MCLQYKPHYIAAGSMFLAAKLQKVKLLTEKGRAWWMEFEVSLKQLEGMLFTFLFPPFLVPSSQKKKKNRNPTHAAMETGS